MIRTNLVCCSQLIIAGQFPPPVNGFSYITKELAGLQSFRHRAAIIDLTPRHGVKGIGYHASRLALALSGVGTIVKHAAYAPKPQVYIACEGGYGLVYTLLLVLAARCVGASLYLHHHSFYYIDRAFPLMALLLKIMGRSVTHIFLSPDMAQRYADRYRQCVRGIVLPNSAFVEPAPQLERSEPSSPEEGLTIGLLGNLNEEKGLGRFIETLRLAKAKGLNVKGILAGPVAAAQDRITLENAKRELADRLDYRGPVYGGDKQAFYKQIDVFVFPTSYPNEAQPTVIFEAMAYGLPTLSIDRGCIKGQVGVAGAVAQRDADFPSFALDHLARWLADPNTFSTLRLDTSRRFLEDRAKALDTAKNLLSITPLTIEPS
ncbi:MAG: glycosyltransferase family 4 protein [Bdellovibrionales bacterium]